MTVTTGVQTAKSGVNVVRVLRVVTPCKAVSVPLGGAAVAVTLMYWSATMIRVLKVKCVWKDRDFTCVLVLVVSLRMAPLARVSFCLIVKETFCRMYNLKNRGLATSSAIWPANQIFSTWLMPFMERLKYDNSVLAVYK